MYETTRSYAGAALQHQQVTARPARMSGALSLLMPTAAQLGEDAGRTMASRWSYEQCEEWIASLDAHEDAQTDEGTERAEYRAGLRVGVAARMAQRAEEDAS